MWVLRLVVGPSVARAGTAATVVAAAAAAKNCRRETDMASEIQVYGAGWCGLTFGVREYLTNARVAYDYHDIDREPEANDLALALTDGRRRFPLVVVHERVLTNPSLVELQRVLDDYRIRAEYEPRRRPAAAEPRQRPRRR